MVTQTLHTQLMYVHSNTTHTSNVWSLKHYTHKSCMFTQTLHTQVMHVHSNTTQAPGLEHTQVMMYGHSNLKHYTHK